MNKLKRFFGGKTRKRVLALVGAIVVMCSMAIPAFAEGATFDGAAAIAGAQSIFTQATSTLTIGNVVSVIGICIGAAVALYLLWWGVRKVLRVVKGAFSKGKVSV